MHKWRGKAWYILSRAVCKNGGGRPGIFYHVNDVDRGGEGSLIERTSLRPCLVVSAPSTEVSNVCEAKNIPLLVRNEERVCEMRSFNGGPLPFCLPT